MPSPWTTLVAHCNSAERITIAAPYIKAPILEELLSHVSNDVDLECFTRWTPHDILVGATDTACRDLVVARGGRFYLHNRLHAKYYRFDEAVLVGSANCTAAGLNYEQTGNLEILCQPAESFDLDEFENQLRAEAREVSDEEFALWLACPVDAPTPDKFQGEPTTNTLEDWKPLARFPEYLWLIYSNREVEATDSEQRERAKTDLQVLRPPQGLSQEQFDYWIKACMVAAPFITSVMRVEETPQENAWEILANEWGLETRAAERARTTAQNWTRHFDFQPEPLNSLLC